MDDEEFQLTEEFYVQLRSALKNPELMGLDRAKIQALLLVHDGSTIFEASQMVGISPGLIHRLIDLAKKNGIAGLNNTIGDSSGSPGSRIDHVPPEFGKLPEEVEEESQVNVPEVPVYGQRDLLPGLTKTWCPYLGTENDQQTAFRFPTEFNLCNKDNYSQAITLLHQQDFCLNENYPACPVYQENWNGRFPKEILPPVGKTDTLRGLGVLIISLAAVGVLVLGLLLQVFIPKRTTLALLRETITAAVTSTSMLSVHTQKATSAGEFLPLRTATYTLEAEASPTLTPVFPTATDTPVLLPTHTPSSTPRPITPTQTPTASLTPSITPGPIPGTPFGSNPELLLHIIQPLDNYSLLSRQYQTTVNVLEHLNPRGQGEALWDGRPVVVAPGQVEIGTLPRFRVVQLDEEAFLGDLALEYQVEVSAIRQYNQLGPGSLIPAGRWLVIPFP